MAAFIALLRGINVGGRNKVPMAELRSLAADLGWDDAKTILQSGNLIFRTGDAPGRLESRLEEAIEGRLGLSIRVIVRPAASWSTYVQSNPYPDASEREPNLVMLALSKAAPKSGAVAGLRERAAAGERIEQAGDALWIHFAGGAARTKLSPALLDRLVGSPVTTRNWRTVLKLHALVH